MREGKKVELNQLTRTIPMLQYNTTIHMYILVYMNAQTIFS